MSILQNLRKTLLGGNLITARDALKIGWSLPPRRTTDIWVDTFHKTPMLDPVHMIASDFASTPYKIFNKTAYRKDFQNAEPFGDHPIYDLLDHPMPDHPEIDYYQLMYLTDVYYEIVGDTFWLIDRQGTKPSGIYIIPPTWMLLTPTKDIPYFRIQPMGNTSHRYFNADPADVVWFKSPDAVNPYGRGRARAESIGDEIETHEFSSKYAKNFFYNDAIPPIILEMPGMSDVDAQRYKESWQERLGGFLNARKLGIVNKKDFKIHQLAQTQKEMDFVESRDFLIRMANEHSCVPPEMRGNTQNSNRATIDSAFYLWSKNVVNKRLHCLSSALNNQFVPMFDKNAIWKFDEIVPEDKEYKLKVLSAGVTLGTATRNEWRVGMDMKPDDERGDVYLMNGFGIEEVPAFKKPEPIEPPAREPPKQIEEPKQPEKIIDDGKSIDLDKVIKELNAATKSISVKSKLSEDQRIAIWKAFDARATGGEAGFKKAVKKIADSQRKKIKGAIEDASEEGIDKALDFIFTQRLNIEVKKELTPAWISSMGHGREHALELLGNGKSYKSKSDDNVTNSWFHKWIELNGLKKAKEINETTNDLLRTNLKATLSEAIENGESLRNQMKRLMEMTDGVYDDMNSYRAEMIARTETGSSVNYGSYATYKTEGIEKKEWISTRDDRTRDDHKEENIEKLVIGIDESFDIGGEKLDFPGDPAGSAGNVINCRCTIAPVVGEEE
jgi:HK97 family phage portal protein